MSLNEGLTTIDQMAFATNTMLGLFVLPSTVTTIGNGAFSYCYQKKILSYAPAKLPGWSASASMYDGILYNYNGKIERSDDGVIEVASCLEAGHEYGVVVASYGEMESLNDYVIPSYMNDGTTPIPTYFPIFFEILHLFQHLTFL